MLIQQENRPLVTSQGTRLQTLACARVVDAEQPVLVLQVGYDLDPGVVRKQSPNEDTLSVTRGVISSTPPKPFTLLIVADGMGGQAHGQEARDICTHPRRNLIYRCLGEKSTVEVDTCEVPLAAGDILLLCSDGLWEMVRDQQIAAILTLPTPDPSQTAHALMQAALAGGGEDNVSAIVVKMSKL